MCLALKGALRTLCFGAVDRWVASQFLQLYFGFRHQCGKTEYDRSVKELRHWVEDECFLEIILAAAERRADDLSTLCLLDRLKRA